jgi:hypothetical protein
MGCLTRAVVIGAALVFNLNCSVNILENFADKNTNGAYLVDAKKLLSERDYDGALAKLALITGDMAGNRSVIMLKASAHAGKCGLEFLPFVEALQSMGSTNLFQVFLSHFVAGTATQMDSCLTAENLVESIGSVSERTSDENMLLVLISFAKIGTTLAYYADSDDDGAIDGGYNTCTVGGSRSAGGNITDADAREIGTAITLAIENISAVSTSVDLGSDALADVSAACSLLNAIPPSGTYNFCTVTDPSGFSPEQLRAIRGLIRETNDGIGLGSCAGGAATCLCP